MTDRAPPPPPGFVLDGASTIDEPTTAAIDRAVPSEAARPSTPEPPAGFVLADATDSGNDVEQDAMALADQLEKLDPSGESGVGELFGNSFVLGLKDKVAGLAGGVGSAIKGEGFSRGYNVSRRAQEILEERARERTGRWGTAAEIAGSVGTGVLARGAAAPFWGGRMLQGAKEAGTLATIQGIGDSESDTIMGTAADAAASGVLGATLGGALTGAVEVGRGVLKAGRAGTRAIGSATDDEAGRAARQVYDKLLADGLTPEQAAARMSKRDTALINVADENTLGLGRAAAAKPGEGRTVLNRALDGQQKVSRQKVMASVNETLGGADQSFNARVADAITTRSNLARGAYQNVYDAGDNAIWSSELERLSSSPSVRSAMRGAVNTWRDRAIADGFGAMNPGANVDRGGRLTFSNSELPAFPNIQFWDYTKRILDDKVQAALRAGQNQKAATLTTLTKTLRTELDSAVPSYKAARETYASQSKLLEALERGREILAPASTKNSDLLATEFGDLSKSEKVMVRLGLARNIQDMVEATPSAAGDVVKKVFGSEAKRNAIRAVFDSDSAFRKFEAEMGKIAKEAKSFQFVRTGARTSFVDAEKADAGVLAEVAGAAMDTTTGGAGTTLVRGALRILKGMGGMDEGVAREVAKLLVERDPDVVRKALSRPAGKAAGQAARSAMLEKARPFVRALTIGSASTAGEGTASRFVGAR